MKDKEKSMKCNEWYWYDGDVISIFFFLFLGDFLMRGKRKSSWNYSKLVIAMPNKKIVIVNILQFLQFKFFEGISNI